MPRADRDQRPSPSAPAASRSSSAQRRLAAVTRNARSSVRRRWPCRARPGRRGHASSIAFVVARPSSIPSSIRRWSCGGRHVERAELVAGPLQRDAPLARGTPPQHARRRRLRSRRHRARRRAEHQRRAPSPCCRRTRPPAGRSARAPRRARRGGRAEPLGQRRQAGRLGERGEIARRIGVGFEHQRVRLGDRALDRRARASRCRAAARGSSRAARPSYRRR